MYVSGCGGILATPTGSFVSPNYPYPYHHNGECFWLIRASAGSTIMLTFADFDLEGGSCYWDYVKVCIIYIPMTHSDSSDQLEVGRK